MVHNMLDGNVIEGSHQKRQFKEIFLKANNALPHHKDGNQLNFEWEERPLKRFLKCDTGPYNVFPDDMISWYWLSDEAHQ